MNKSIPSLLCRVCEQAEETILHLLSSCPSLAVSTYLYCHNLVRSKCPTLAPLKSIFTATESYLMVHTQATTCCGAFKRFYH